MPVFLAALLIGVAVGRITADTGVQPSAPEFQRFQLYQGQFHYIEGDKWNSSVATFRLDTKTGETSIYMGRGGNAGALAGFWSKIDH